MAQRKPERRVHAVLDLEADRADAEHDEALEQRLRQASDRGLLAHDDRPKLAVVANEDKLLRAQHDRHHALRLGGLEMSGK